MMQVRVKLNATLRKYLPATDTGGIAVLDLPHGATVADAIEQLGIPADHAQIIVSGDEHLEPTSMLNDGQEVNLFPPVAGG
jgi:molybdopterin converting factor small subunit